MHRSCDSGESRFKGGPAERASQIVSPDESPGPAMAVSRHRRRRIQSPAGGLAERFGAIGSGGKGNV